MSTGISALAINPFIPYHLVCSGLDGIVRFYDRRKLSVGSSFSSSKGVDDEGEYREDAGEAGETGDGRITGV